MIQLNLTEMKEKFIEGCKSAVEGIQNPRKLAQGLNRLTKFQMMEIGAVVLVLGGVTYVLYSNVAFWLGKGPEKTIMVWVDRPTLPKPPAPPPAPSPGPLRGRARMAPAPQVVAKVIIPKGYTVTTVFDSVEGRLEFRDIGGTGEKIMHGVAFFAGPNLPDYQDAWAHLRLVRDPARRMITLAAIGIADQRPWTLPTDAGLSTEQQATITTAETTLKEDLAALNTSIMNGSFETALHDKAYAALQNYQAKASSGEEAKTAAAKATIDAGMEYGARIEDARQKAIQKYVDTVDKLLDASQHEALSDVASELATGRKKG